MDARTDADRGQFELDEDQRAIQAMASAFAADRVAPIALDWDRERHFPDDVIRETGPLGFGGIGAAVVIAAGLFLLLYEKKPPTADIVD